MTSIQQHLNKKLKARPGITLVELCISCALMSLVLMLAISLINLSATSFVATNMQVGMISADAEFASKLTESIRESTVAFTVPGKSFTEDKLTAGWNYLGLMNDVKIPAAVNKTGKSGEIAEALVYIEYVGDTAPAAVPADSNLIATASDGYFLQRVIDYSYTDNQGVKHDYTLEFSLSTENNAPGKALNYKFYSEAKKADGTITGTDTKGIDIDSVINALNSVQVVYKGSPDNPATALAFNSNFMPTFTAGNVTIRKPPATIVLVMDISKSMNETFLDTTTNNTKTRISGLKDKVIELIEKYKENENVNYIIVPYSNFAGCQTSNDDFYREWNYILPGDWIYNARDDYKELKSMIAGLSLSGRTTNTGDALRVAYFKLKNFVTTHNETGPVYFIVITDGEMNVLSTDKNVITRNNQIEYTASLTKQNFYKGSLTDPLDRYGNYQYRTHGKVINRSWDTDLSREYASYWCRQIVNDRQLEEKLEIGEKWMLCLGDPIDMAADKAVFQNDLGATTVDIDSMSAIEETFNQIGENLDASMWAFEGPRN